MAEADKAADSNGQHSQHHEQQLPHLDPADPAAVSFKVVESDADQLSVVWCDVAELCDRCSSTDSTHASSSHADGAASDADGATAGCSCTGQQPAGHDVSTAAAAPGKGVKGHSKNGSMKQCGGGRVKGGRLAMLSWNDSYALQAAHLQSEKAFGGSSRAG
jgi:hypothetical protein